MSGDFETAHPTSRKTEPGLGPARRPADRDHDAQKARPTSMTGMRRVAEAPPKSKPDAATAQHDKAESASFDGIKAALIHGAASIRSQAADIDTLIRDPGDRGPSVAIEHFTKIFEAVDVDLSRLSTETSTQVDSTVRRYLANEAQQLAGAVERFSAACDRGRAYAIQHHGSFEKNPYHLKQYIESIYSHLGLDKTTPSKPFEDPRSDAELFKQTIRDNLTAAEECARAVRVGLAAGGSKVEEDTKKLLGHLREVRGVLRRSKDPAAAQSFKTQLRQVLAAVRALEPQSANHPPVAGLLKNADASLMIDDLAKKVR